MRTANREEGAMLKSWTMIVVLFVLSVAPAAHADDKSYRAAILEYFELADMNGLMKRSIDVMLSAQVQSNPGLAPLAPKLREFLDKYMGWASLRDEFVEIYKKAFTEAEFKQMLAFYKTPVGRKSLQQVPALMEQGAQIGARRVQEHMGELQQMLQPSARPAPH
jgi:hypothetical protein